jgi:hypothetical protein
LFHGSAEFQRVFHPAESNKNSTSPVDPATHAIPAFRNNPEK